MMSVSGFPTKKSLKAFIGQNIAGRIVETSMFGTEYKPTLDGPPVVGPSLYKRKWFAQIWVKDDILVKVK